MGDVAREVLAADARAVSAVAEQIGPSFDACVRLVLDAPGRVVTVGAGTSGTVAQRLAHLLSVCGTPAFCLHPSDALHGSLGAVQSGDVVIALSKGGHSTEVNETCARAQSRGARVVAVTADAGSPFAEPADHVVTLTTPPGADPGEVVAMGSTVAYSAWSDALVTVLMRARSYSWQDVLSTHPSGKVGQMTSLPEELGALEVERDGAGPVDS